MQSKSSFVVQSYRLFLSDRLQYRDEEIDICAIAPSPLYMFNNTLVGESANHDQFFAISVFGMKRPPGLDENTGGDTQTKIETHVSAKIETHVSAKIETHVSVFTLAHLEARLSSNPNAIHEFLHTIVEGRVLTISDEELSGACTPDIRFRVERICVEPVIAPGTTIRFFVSEIVNGSFVSLIEDYGVLAIVPLSSSTIGAAN